ncbi:hypothetical protein LguiA_017809 [Lonicera macranthoides]
MRRTGEIDQVTVQALVDGLGFQTFTEEGDYAAFASRYLMREPKGTRGRVFYERYRALGGDPHYIRGQTHLARAVPGHLPPVPDQKDNIPDSEDEDPEGERDVPAAAEGGGRPEGEGGDATAVPEPPPQATPMGEQCAEGFEFPTGPSVSPGGLFAAAEAAEGRAGFSERSWEPADLGADYDQFGRTPPAAATTPSSGVPHLRATAMVDPPGVRTYATLTPLPTTVMGPPARSPGFGGSSSRPLLFPIREEGGSTSAAAPAGSSIPWVDLPPLPRDISYVGAGLRRYPVPEYPLPEDTFDYLGGRPGDERVSVRVADLRAWHAQYLYSWNLLQYVGRDPPAYMRDYQRAIDVSLRPDDPLTSSHARTDSRRSSSRTSRRSRSSVIRPTAPVQSTGPPQAAVPSVPDVPVVDLTPEEGSGDSGSVSKRARID